MLRPVTDHLRGNAGRGCREVPGQPRRAELPSEQVGRHRRADHQHRVERMCQLEGGGRVEEPVERREQQRVELIVRVDHGPADLRRERELLRDRHRQANRLQLVGLDEPVRHLQRVEAPHQRSTGDDGSQHQGGIRPLDESIDACHESADLPALRQGGREIHAPEHRRLSRDAAGGVARIDQL